MTLKDFFFPGAYTKEIISIQEKQIEILELENKALRMMVESLIVTGQAHCNHVLDEIHKVTKEINNQ